VVGLILRVEFGELARELFMYEFSELARELFIYEFSELAGELFIYEFGELAGKMFILSTERSKLMLTNVLARHNTSPI
jgi:hypothetical protein